MSNTTRFAPTASGHMHLGNFFNLIFTFWMANRVDAKVILRIDDYDSSRTKDEFLESILRCLEVLPFSFVNFPGSVSEFKKTQSQQLFTEEYFEKLKLISNKYNCDCTRKEWSEYQIYPLTCAKKGLEFKPGTSQIRFDVKNKDEPFYKSMGDFVLWRKENIPSYQWVSLCDDISMGVTHIMRGIDLWESSMAQSYLAFSENIDFVGKEHIYHHSLLTDGLRKLSKSQGDNSVYELLKASQGPSRALKLFCDFYGVNARSYDELFQQDFEDKLAINTQKN